MTSKSSRRLVLLAAVAMLPATAQAQIYGSANSQPPPLYPYAVQPGQPYAIEVSPGTYVIQRPAAARPYPYVRDTNARKPAQARPARAKPAPASDRPRKPVDHALIEELRERAQKNKRVQAGAAAEKNDSAAKKQVINTTRIVREKPTVIETTRIVDDPPRVIERYRVVEDAPQSDVKRAPAAPQAGKRPNAADDKKRVIRAEAEVTILGPDRMSIRLFRKGDKANASAD